MVGELEQLPEVGRSVELCEVPDALSAELIRRGVQVLEDLGLLEVTLDEVSLGSRLQLCPNLAVKRELAEDTDSFLDKRPAHRLLLVLQRVSFDLAVAAYTVEGVPLIPQLKVTVTCFCDVRAIRQGQHR